MKSKKIETIKQLFQRVDRNLFEFMVEVDQEGEFDYFLLIHSNVYEQIRIASAIVISTAFGTLTYAAIIMILWQIGKFVPEFAINPAYQNIENIAEIIRNVIFWFISDMKKSMLFRGFFR